MDSVLENELLSLFDYQRYQNDNALSDIIKATEQRYAHTALCLESQGSGDDLAKPVDAAADTASLENQYRGDETTT